MTDALGQATIGPREPLRRQGEALCEQCQSPLTKRRQKRFCSAACRSAWHESVNPRLRDIVARLPRPESKEPIRQKIFTVLTDGRWYTVAELAEVLQCRENTAAAKMRDLRKTEHGGFRIDHKTRQGTREHEFRLVLGGAKK